MFFIITATLVCSTIILLHIYISSNYDYWKKKKIFYLKPKPFFGNFFKVGTFQMHTALFLKELYHKVDQPFFGLFMFRTPYLFIKDANLAKHIMVQDFESFNERTLHCNANDGMSSNLLICMKPADWRIMRQKLTPFFSPGKLKNMIYILDKIGEDLVKHIDQNPENIEAKELCSKYTIDVICRFVLATDSKCLLDENAEFKRIGSLYFEVGVSTAMRYILYSSMPSLIEFFKISLFNSKANNFIKEVMTESISTREKNPMVGNDLIDLILQLKGDDEFCKKHKFYGDKITAQAIMFFVAGFETVSALISFTLYHLAIHPHIQTKVRQEIQGILGNRRSMNFECLQEMEYFDMVLSEVLRKNPSVPYIDRMCTQDYKIPGTETVIEKGTRIFLPIMAMHYDEKYFPNPNEFIPERFAEKGEVPFAYMPFGQGPKKCIGERLGIIKAKIAITKILMNFEVLKTEKTPCSLVFEAKSITLTSSTGLPLRFKKLAL